MTANKKSNSITKSASTTTAVTFGDNWKSPVKISYQKGQNCRDRTREIDASKGDKTTRNQIVRSDELVFCKERITQIRQMGKANLHNLATRNGQR